MNTPNSQHMKRGIELAGEYIAAILENPTLLERVPDGTTITLVPDDDPELAESNISVGLDAVRRGEDVYFVHINKMAPAARP